MDVSILLLGRFGAGIGEILENEETKPPKPRNDRNQRCAEILNGQNRGRVERSAAGDNHAPGTTRVLR